MRCTKNNCTVIVYSGPNKNIVIKSNEQHNHIGHSPNKLEFKYYTKIVKDVLNRHYQLYL